MTNWIGQPLPRFEDLRLLSGAGRYTDDISLPGQVYAAFLRSPHAHAKILNIDTRRALAAPGVLAVLTAAEWNADGLGAIEHLPNPADAVDHTQRAFVAAPGEKILDLHQPPFPSDKVRYVGEAVAVVIAQSVSQAKDATELIDVEYEALPAVVSPVAALAQGAPLVYDDVPGNLCFRTEYGDRDRTEQAFREAVHVVRREFVNQRIANCQMEPRAALGAFDAASGLHTLITGSQGVVRLRAALAGVFHLPQEKIRVVTPDVGGGFGPRTMPYIEQIVVVWAARRLGCPVKWNSDRSEAFLSDFQGRDLVTRAALALSKDGAILALDVELFGAIGAHTVSYVPLSNGYRLVSTVYDVPVAHVRVKGALTHTVPTTPYRGAGRPEATLAIERLLDIAARDIGIDRIELRRRNLVSRAALPYRSVMGLTYDSGDFAGNMARALQASDWNGFSNRREAAKARGRLAGIGLSNYIESPVGAPREKTVIAVHAAGYIEVVIGTQSTGQGHETSFAQVVGDRLGVPVETVRIVTGDTDRVDAGGGTHSDRSMRLAGAILVRACDDILVHAKRLAAHLLGVREEGLRFEDGRYRKDNDDRSCSLFDLAREIDCGESLSPELKRPLCASAEFNGRMPAFPTGCAVCELEIDPDTGVVQIVRYTAIDDVGMPINPLIVEGQVHGGIAQGIGQALHENFAFDPGSGQALAASFMDYGIARASDLPAFDVSLAEDPTAGNPLGVKGAGESGTTPAAAAVVNALADALSGASANTNEIGLPVTPQRLWAALRGRR